MEEQIEAAFKLFDIDKSKEIDENDFKRTLEEMDVGFSLEEIKNLLDSQEGTLDLNSFKEAILGRK